MATTINSRNVDPDLMDHKFTFDIDTPKLEIIKPICLKVHPKYGWRLLTGNSEWAPSRNVDILFTFMKNNDVNFPFHFGDFLESLWKKIVMPKGETMTEEKVQKILNDIASWITETEKNAEKIGEEIGPDDKSEEGQSEYVNEFNEFVARFEEMTNKSKRRGS